MIDHYKQDIALTPDLQEALSCRYGTDLRFIARLSSGKFAVYHPYMRQLIAICDTLDECFMVADIPPPPKRATPEPILDLEIEIRL